MINKQSLWFLTLFSLILVLSVYYITMPNDLLISNNSNYLKTEEMLGKKYGLDENSIFRLNYKNRKID